MISTSRNASIKKIRSINSLLDSRDDILLKDPDCLTKEFIREVTGYHNQWSRKTSFKNVDHTKIGRVGAGDFFKKYWADPINRKLASERNKKRYENPEARLKISIGGKRRYQNPEERRKSSLCARGRITRTGSRERLVESAIGGFWYGNVRYYSGPQYCEKWTDDLKERVRAFFGYRCIECGTLQNGRSLHVHHVWYNKSACCDDTPRSLVPLCHGCHSKTSNKNNRQYWSRHFQSMIDNFYGGRCWLTKEEMATFKKEGVSFC